MDLLPFITATDRITNMISEEQDPEFLLVRPDGFTVEPGMILAIGNIHEIDIAEVANATSVVDIQPKYDIEPGEVRLDFAQPHIMVYVSAEDHTRILDATNDARASRRQSLWPSLYLNVITEGIRSLPDYQEFAWARAFEGALRRSGFDPEDEESLRREAFTYAQRIIFEEKKRYPLGMMLDSFNEEDHMPVDSEDYD